MAHDVTFGMLGSVIFDLTLAGGPVPPGLHSPRVESSVTVTCTERGQRPCESGPVPGRCVLQPRKGLPGDSFTAGAVDRGHLWFGGV